MSESAAHAALPQPDGGRNHRFDNIKFLLMLLVLIGHFLELTPKGGHMLYRVIYSFHMPAFIFVTGCFSRFKRERVFTLSLTYIVFQLLYLLADSLWWKGKPFSFELSYPYWILWYIFAVVVYTALIPLIDTGRRGVKWLVFAASVAVSLLSGFDRGFGYFLSLSRILVFLPFFVAGYYLRGGEFLPRLPRAAKIAGFAVLALIALIAVARTKLFTPAMLYGSCSYEAAEGSVWVRAALLLIAFAWTGLLLNLPLISRKIPVISTLGKNTLPVFLLHGFIVKSLAAAGAPAFAAQHSYAFAFLCAIAVFVLLGNPIVAGALDLIFKKLPAAIARGGKRKGGSL